MTVRVELEALPESVRQALSRGDDVEVSDRGRRVARLTPAREDTDWAAFWKARAGAPPLDYDDFLRDIEETREALNAPMTDLWETSSTPR